MDSELNRVPAISPEAQKTIVIAGVGLIGGSIGLCLHQNRSSRKVIGLGRSLERLQNALDLGAIDDAETDWAKAMAEADIVVLCGPVSTIAEQARQAWRNRRSDQILITDAGSTKAGIIQDLESEPQLLSAFVGAHPIAGSARSGVSASQPDMFQGKACVLTPTEQTRPDQLQKARSFWAGLGCRLVEMTPADHDRALAQTSHLPHVLAAALARCVDMENHSLTAGAFRDMTRIAAADGELWRDIFLSNRESLDKALDTAIIDLLKFRELLMNESSAGLENWWTEARHRRSAYEQLMLQTCRPTVNLIPDSEKKHPE